MLYHLQFYAIFFTSGKYAPDGVEILPLDLASSEDSLAEAVKKAESFFSGAGVDYMIHNAACERPVIFYPGEIF